MIKNIKRHHYALLVLLGVLSSIYIFWYKSDAGNDLTIIRDFNESEDYVPLATIINQNFFWLNLRDKASVHQILSWRAPNQDERRKGQATIKVAEYDGEVAGFIAYAKNSPKEGLIWLLAVGKDFRGHYLGEKLMKSAIENLKQQGSQHIIIHTRTINKAALGLYRKLGFKEKITYKDQGIVTLILRNL